MCRDSDELDEDHCSQPLAERKTLFRPDIVFDEFVLVMLALFFGGVFAKLRESFQQIGNVFLIPSLSQRLNQSVEGSLILWIMLEGFSALLSCFAVVPCFQVELRQHTSGPT